MFLLLIFFQTRDRYGQETLIGSLRSNRYSFGKRQVCEALQTISSVASNQRKVRIGRLLSPRVYKAIYFGHKVHYNQNEKLGIHGAVYVCARDGYSNMIIEFPTIAIKNLLKSFTRFICNLSYLFVHFYYTSIFCALFQCFRHLKNAQISKIALLNYLIFYQAQILWIFLIFFVVQTTR